MYKNTEDLSVKIYYVYGKSIIKDTCLSLLIQHIKHKHCIKSIFTRMYLKINLILRKSCNNL